MNNKYVVDSLRITPATGWLDVTGEIEAENPPFSLAKSDGVGVVQFSTATLPAGTIAERDARGPKNAANRLRVV